MYDPDPGPTKTASSQFHSMVQKTSHFPAQCSCPERPSIPITRFAALFSIWQLL